MNEQFFFDGLLMINWTLVWVPLVIVLILLVCSALFAGSEVAVFSLSPAQKEELRESKDRNAEMIIDLLEKPDREQGPRQLLATITLANNTVNIAIVLLSTRIVTEIFPVNNSPEWLVFLIHVVIVTFVLVLFGEVIPKIYATSHNMGFARFMALPLTITGQIFKPITWLLMRISRVFEDKMNRKQGGNISVDDLGHALELTADDNRSEEEHKILEGIVTFGEKEVGQIMTSRLDIVSLNTDLTFGEVLEIIIEKGYSRMPVYHESPDVIEGFLFIKDLLPYTDESEFDWQKVIRPPYFVPENKKIDDLLQEFQKDKIHLAIVVDEYGGTSGLVTLEDILEEIVGDISDEFDEEDLRYSKLDERNFVFEGKTSLVDFCRILELDGSVFEESKGDNHTLAGFLIEQAKKIPGKGETIEFNGFQFTVEAADNRKIKRVKITLPDNFNHENS
jgi:gliding motility-associated protein GldE